MFSRRNSFLLITVILASLILIPKTFCQNQPISSGSLVQDKITSPSLQGNLLGDPSTRNFIIYLPPSYKTSLNKRYPVVYLMHGSGGNERSWAYNEYPEFVTKSLAPPTDFPEDGFADMIDRLIADGKIKEMIIVMPDVSNKYGGSYCINSELNGNYEDYIIEDLVPYVDAHYRTLANSASRGIDGISMGGYISIYLAMRHPDVFGAVSSHAGPLLLEATVRSLQPFVMAENPDGFTGPSPDKPVTSFFYMGCSAMTPNLNNPPFFVDLPYDDKFQIREDILKRIAKYDPVQMIPEYIDALKSLRGIFLDAGDKDELGLYLAVKGFSDALNASGIENEIEIFDGAHLDKLYTRLAIALEFLSSKLVGQEDFKAIVKGIGEAINAHDVDKILSYLADDIVYEFVPSPQPMTSKEEVRKFFEDLFKAFPDYKTISEHALFSDNMAVTEHVVRATLQGEWMGMPPTGKGGDLPHIDIWEFEGDKVKRVRTYLDMATQMMVVGVLPMPELPEFKPSFVLPNPEPKGLSPVEAMAELDRLWNAHDLLGYAKMFRTDAEIFIAPLGIPMSRDDFIASQEMYMQVFSPQTEVVNTHDLGNGWVVEEHIYKGTHINSYMGIPATGRKAAVRGTVLCHFDKDGLVTHFHNYWDNITLLTQLGAFPPVPTPEDISKALIRRCYDELWNQKKVDVIAEIRSADVIYHDPAAGDIIGIEAGKLLFAQNISAIPDIKVTLEDVVAEGDMASARVTMTGTNQGEAFGLPATGKKVTITALTFIKVANGKIIEEWAMWDVMGMLEQIGAVSKVRQDYSWGPKSQVTGAPSDPEKNKAVVMRYAEEVFNQKKLNVLDEIIHPQGISHDPNISNMEDIAFMKQAILIYLSAFPDLRATNLALIAEDDMVAGLWTVTGTHQGEILGIPPTGRKIQWTVIVMYRFADGKIVEQWWAYDVFGIVKQLTAQAPADKEALREFSKSVIENVWNKKNLSFIDEKFSPSYVEHSPSGVGDLKGTTIYKQFVSTYVIGFPNINFDLQDAIVEDNLAVIRWTAYGTHLGPVMGVPPSGKVGPGTTGISIMKIENNILLETWAEYDMLGLMGWLGLIPGRELQQWGEPSKITGNPGDPETNKALVRRFTEEFFNQKKLDKFGEFVHPKVISHDPVISPTEDYETLRQILGVVYPSAFPDVRADINMLIAENDKVVGRWTLTGTHKGEYFGIPPTGKPIKMTGIAIFRIADGKIVEIWWSYDALGVLQQIGVIPTGTPKDYTNVFFMSLSQGLNMISLPLEPVKPYTARSLAQELGATVVIKYDTDNRRFFGFVLSAPHDGFFIKGGEGYIVNVLESKTVAFTGAAWTNTPPVKTAPSVLTDSSWAFVFSGSVLDGDEMKIGDDGYKVIIRNLQTGKILEDTTMPNGYFAIADADLNRKPVIKAGDKVEITVIDSRGKVVSGPFVRSITLDDIRNALANFQLKLGDIIPERTALLQNYPNPFNPETWIPFQLKEAGEVSIRIYDSSGRLIRSFDLGHKPAGVYISKPKAVYWDGKNEAGERVASGVYFYTITSGKFSDIKKMVVSK